MGLGGLRSTAPGGGLWALSRGLWVQVPPLALERDSAEDHAGLCLFSTFWMNIYMLV